MKTLVNDILFGASFHNVRLQ